MEENTNQHESWEKSQQDQISKKSTAAVLTSLEAENEASNLHAKRPRQKKGRRKIDIVFIEEKSRRHITFSKRKAGIMKKAYELATLTGTQVLLLVASETGHVYTFATPKLQPLITKPDGKNLIQACLNSPDMSEGQSANNLESFTGGKTIGLRGAPSRPPENSNQNNNYSEHVEPKKRTWDSLEKQNNVFNERNSKRVKLERPPFQLPANCGMNSPKPSQIQSSDMYPVNVPPFNPGSSQNYVTAMPIGLGNSILRPIPHMDSLGQNPSGSFLFPSPGFPHSPMIPGLSLSGGIPRRSLEHYDDYEDEDDDDEDDDDSQH